MSFNHKRILDDILFLMQNIENMEKISKNKFPKGKSQKIGRSIDNLIKNKNIEYFTTNNKNKYKCFKNYKTSKKLGKGAFGEVSLAIKNKKKYAIKVIKLFDPQIKQKWERTDEEDLNIFKEEVNTLKKTSKYKISPKIYDSYICKDGNKYLGFIVMDFLNGGTLGELFKNGEYITKNDIKNIEKKIKLLRKHKIIHNDLHANNIVYNINKKDERDFFIIDFGLSKHKKDIKITNDVFKKISSQDMIEFDKIKNNIDFYIQYFVLIELIENDIIDLDF